MRVPRVMGGGGSRFRKGGGGWWQSRAGENAVCKAGGEFKRSCAERMASPRATLPRFFSLGLVLARTRATTSLDATSRAPTRRYHQRGKEKHTEGATDTETDSETKREGSSGREEEEKRHGPRVARTKTERVTALWLPLTFPHRFSLTCLPVAHVHAAKLRSPVSRTPDAARTTCEGPCVHLDAALARRSSRPTRIISPGSVATCPLDGPPRRNNHV